MSHRLQVLIPTELEASLRKAAQRDRVSKGEWVRRAIRGALRESTVNPVERLAALEGPTGDIDQMIGEIDSGRP